MASDHGLARPPEFELDGLWQALARLDQLLKRATESADAGAAAGAAQEPYRGLYITSDDVQRMLKREPGQPLLAGAGGNGEPQMPAASRFPWLQKQFQLEPFDVDVILVALAGEVDLRYERLYAYLHDDVTRRRPSVELAMNLLCATREAKITARARFSPDAPLVRQRLVHLVADAGLQLPLLAHSIKLDDSVVRFLLGQGGLDGRLQAFAQWEAKPEAEPTASLHMARAAELVGQKQNARLYFQGPKSAAKQAGARALAARFQTPLLTAQLPKLGGTAAEFEADLRVLLREAQVAGAVLLLQGYDSLRTAERAPQQDVLRTLLNETVGVVILEGTGPADPAIAGIVPVAFQEPDFATRREAWDTAVAKHGSTLDAQALDDLASRYRLEPERIASAVEIAAQQASLSGAKPKAADLARAARQQVRSEPGALASMVRPVYLWEDLVLPADQVAQLRELCKQARYRHIVLGDWGFEQRLSLGKGLSALFSGPPGTGKTMAVEVIANDLGLDVFKIDLSQVVSKYIGETEKNIDRLFQEARASNAMLFFDECDALFGKRTAVQDAHDRYANIEIAYLLQKMDEHEGISILATNLRQNLDAAFVRRLNFIVEFPFPDETSRRAIWKKIWPSGVPRSRDLDLEFMASQFKISGGAVKNIALAAAYLAAAEDKPELKTEHLLWATRRELEKAGRSVSRTEFGRYAERMATLAGSGK